MEAKLRVWKDIDDAKKAKLKHLAVTDAGLEALIQLNERVSALESANTPKKAKKK